MDIVINDKFKPLFTSTKRYNLSYGGRGSGKSYVMGQLFVLKLLGDEFFRGVLVRQSSSDIRGSQFREIKDYLTEIGMLDKVLIRENTMEFVNLENGNSIISKGMIAGSGNQTAKMKSIKDPTHAWIEEADEVQEDDFIKLDTSIRTKKVKYQQLYLTFNPENEASWINKKWFRENKGISDSKTLIIHSTYLDNLGNLSDSYIDTLQALKQDNPEYAKVYIDGLWGGGKKGRIFKHFKPCLEEDFPRDELHCFYGLDFGWNDKTALVRVYKKGRTVWIEELIYKSELEEPDLLVEMSKLGIDKKSLIFADWGAPTMIAALKRHGYNVRKADKRKDSIKYGVRYITGLNVNLHKDSENFWSEHVNYTWKKKAGDEFTDEPIDEHNHLMDALRYALSEFSMKMRKGIRRLY